MDNFHRKNLHVFFHVMCFESLVELKKRTEQVKQLIHHIKLSDSKHKSTVHALEIAVSRIKQLEKEASTTSSEAQGLKVGRPACIKSVGLPVSDLT